VVYFAGLLNNGRSDLPIVGEGVDPARENRMGSGVIISAGRVLVEKDNNGMMIGHGLAHTLKIKPGETGPLWS